ncbi:MAG: hypothetical protein RL757_2624 [Bacteroidota bacterium]|jgi:aspartate racemase
MKTIGIIGGLSWESSSVVYQIINRKTQEILGGCASGRSLMYSVDLAEVAALQHAGEWEKIGEIMADATRRLDAGGADFIILCTNTLHKLSNYITDNTNLPFLHICDITAANIKSQGMKKVGLLGTKFTMQQAFMRDFYRNQHQIETIVPNEKSLLRVHDIIYDELIKGIFTESSRAEYAHIIGELAAAGAEGVILGCTEIGLLIQQSHTPVRLIDTTVLQAEAAVKMSLGI